jgi:hypothetical protein
MSGNHDVGNALESTCCGRAYFVRMLRPTPGSIVPETQLITIARQTNTLNHSISVRASLTEHV